MRFRQQWISSACRTGLPGLIVLSMLACRLPYELGRQAAGAIFTPTPSASPTTVLLTPVAPVEPTNGTMDLTETTYPPSVYPELPADGNVPVDPYPEAGTSEQTASTDYPSIPLDTETVVEALSQPATSLPTITPFLTATPTATPSPTPTFTPLPPPPWMAAPLKETDPRTVALASGGVQLVEFFAYWSGPSQAMSPIVRGIEAEYVARVKFIYLDIDNPAARPLMEELGFRTEPHFFILAADGKVLEEWIGTATPAKIRAALDAALSR